MGRVTKFTRGLEPVRPKSVEEQRAVSPRITDPELALVINSWPQLSKEVKEAILALITREE